MDHDIPGITPLGHDGQPFLPFRQIVGQIDPAEGIPIKLIDLIGLSDQYGLVHHGDRTLTVADDGIDFFFA